MNESVRVEILERFQIVLKVSTADESVHASNSVREQTDRRVSETAPSSRPLINWRIKSHLQLRINTRINNDNDFCFLSFQVHVEAHGVNNEMFECSFVLSQPPQSPAVSDRNTRLLPW